jgi:hypothetical protein
MPNHFGNYTKLNGVDQGSANISEKGQTINASGFAGQTVCHNSLDVPKQP